MDNKKQDTDNEEMFDRLEKNIRAVIDAKNTSREMIQCLILMGSLLEKQEKRIQDLTKKDLMGMAVDFFT